MKEYFVEGMIAWQEQILVNENSKEQMVIDYPLTKNRFDLLDTYPLPSIESYIVPLYVQYNWFV